MGHGSKLQALLDRFLTSASFAAYGRLMNALAMDGRYRTVVAWEKPMDGSSASSSSTATAASAAMAAAPLFYRYSLSSVLIPVAFAGAVAFGAAGARGPISFRGLQNLCAMVAGQGLANLLPLASEPSGPLLLLPSLVLYFATLGALGCAADRLLMLSGLFSEQSPVPAAVGAIFEHYTALFATTRAIRAFQRQGGEGQLALLSLVYMLLPDRVAPGVGGGAWHSHLVSCVEALAVRVGMQSIGAALTWWCSAAHNDEALIVLYLVAVHTLGGEGGWPVPSPRKLEDCRSMLALLCAQQCLALMQRVALSAPVMIVLWLALLGVPWPSKRKLIPDDVCTFGGSLVMVQVLEQWFVGFGALEACSAFMCLFALLDCLRSERWSGTQAVNSALFFAQNEGEAAWIADELPFTLLLNSHRSSSADAHHFLHG